MKARINYKSKKTIIIIAIAVVLLIAAITGTVAYIKGNNNAAAAMENTEVTEPANNGNDSNNNGGVENPNTPNTDNPEQIPIIDDNQNPTTPAQNGDTTTNPGTTTNQGTTTGTTTGNAETTVPDTEYTQTTVVENPWKTEDITWAPISLQAITANNGLEICVPSFSIEKSSEIVKYSENKSDKAEVGDTIKYTITVTNTGKVTLKDIEVRDDMVGVSTTIKTLEVGRNEKILAEHVVSEEDIIKSLDNDGIITNIATAIYRNEEKETENTVEAKNEYNLTIKYIYEDGKQAAETYTETLIPKASYNVESPKIEGYKADKTVVQGEMPFSDVEETVVYTIDEDAKKELSYTVEYYKDGQIVSGDTQTVKTEVQVLQPDTLTVKKEDINTVNKYYGYKFEKTDPTTIPETVSNGDVIKVYYVIDEEAKKELSYTVEYYKDGKIVSGDTQTVKTEVQVLQPDTLTVNKDTINTVNKYYGYKFEKTDPTTIPETVSNGDVIKVYYVLDEEAKKELSYTVEYYKDGEIVSGDTQTVKTEVQVLQPDTLTVKKEDINTVNKYYGYKFEKTDPTTIPETVSNGDVIKVYYVLDEDAKKELSYTVEYYKDGEIVSGDTQTVKTEVQVLQPDTLTVKKDTINTVNKYYGYKFEKTDPTTIPETVSNGDVIKVYYVLDEEAKKELSYTVEYYKDGEIVSGDTQTVKTEVQVLQPDTLTVKKEDINTVNKYYGYKFEKTDPTTIPETVSNGDVIKVYYVLDEDAKKELSYTVEYYKDGEIVSGDTQTVKTEVQVLQPDTLTVKKEDINTVNKYYGYKFEKTDPTTIPETVSNGDVIKVYYVIDEEAKKELSYKVEYYKDGQIVSEDTQTVKTEVQVLQPDTLTVNKDTINTVNKYYGYKFEKTDPTTIPETVSNGDVIKVYYVIDEEAKKELSYTVEYYKDGEIVSGDTQTVKTEVQVLQPDTLTVNKENINTVNKYEGYRFEKTDPTTIPETVSNGDVIKVYYVKRTDLTYTVHYYYNGIEAEEELVTVPGQKYLAEVSDVDHKATYNGVTYEEYDRTTSNGTMPLIIGLGTNYINVYYGTPNVTINKEVNKSTANAGDILHYTIKVTEDRGLVDAKNIKVTDNLPSELNVIQESITQDGKLNDAKTSIEWNVEKLGKGQNIKFEFDAKIKESSIGEVITNKATLNGNTDSNDAITTVNGKTVEVREITKGREADDVNIIFIMDNSSSMNEPIANTSYLNDDSYYVAPSDEQKTRLNSAKTATKEFINKIYADKNLKNTNMSVITFNNNESDKEDTAYVIGKGPYARNELERDYWGYYVRENGEKIYVGKATDGNYYEIKEIEIKTGANVVGGATSSNYSDLVTKVDGITIGCRREGFGTYINPALKQAKTIIEGYKNNEATKANRNIVIVLCDGDINGKYADSLNDLKGDKDKAGLADEIYCIGFGKDAANPKKNAYKTLANMTTVYEKDKSGKLVKKVYTAENTETLIQEFTSILENMNDKKNYITGVSDIVSDIKCGEIAIKASDILEMPLVVYNNDTEVINCASKEELANYGMSYDESNQIIRWDINECIEKNPNIDLSGTLKLRYYIPLN